jgi:hypothetical protein
MMADTHKIGVKCRVCGKRVYIKDLAFQAPTDITHIVELVMKLEEKGWECPASLYSYSYTSFRLDPRCEACIQTGKPR